MQQTNNMDNFYEALKDISIINNNLDKKREQLRNLVKNYNTNTKNISLDSNLLSQNKELGKFLETSVALLKESSYKWVKNFDALLEKEKFRSDLKNYFIVIIFGKVKAGKSSLGNFIAQNRPQQEQVAFFKYDEAGAEQSIKKLEEIDEGFETNNLECTSAIQGFKLGGMAWIDTPGLGSMTPQNGALAKEYIQSADYVIYPTSSDSPLQADEIDQLKELFAQNKKVTICITKSDTKEKKKDKDGKYIKKDGEFVKFVVNKSPENRKVQEEYVQTEIKKIIDKNKESLLGDILPISAHTAKQGLEENDKGLLENSNIPKFYELITDVVKTKSKRLKEEAPYDGLKSFIDNDILGDKDTKSSTNAIKNSLIHFDSKILEAQERLKVIQSNTLNDIESEIYFIISPYAMEFTKDNWKAKIEQIDQEIIKNIESIFSKNINEVLQKFSFSLTPLKNSLNNLDDFEVKNEYKEIKVRYVDNSWKNVWGLFGDKYSYASENIRVGDNKEEMLLNFKKNRIDLHTKYMTEQYQNISKSFFGALTNESKKINQDILALEESIKNYKNTLKG